MKKILKEHKWNYIFLLPMLLLFVSFTIYPIYNVIVYSFYNWDGLGPLEDFIGLSNYLEVVRDPYYWNAMVNTIVFALAHLVLQAGLAMIFAVLLNNTTSRLKKIYRLLIFIPVITTTSIIGMVMAMIFDPISGPINLALKELGLVGSPIQFLSSPDLVLGSVIAVSVWKNIGVSLVYWMAALQTVPQDVYESAKIDGANPFQIFRRITLPIVAPFGAVIALFAFKNGLHPFDIVKTMTNGGPVFASDVIDTYVYRYAFNSELSITRYGFSAAGGVLFAIIILCITLMSNRISAAVKK